MQAEILAKYKPKINATLLIRDLAQDEEAAAKAVEYFNTTRHTVVYYEDVLNNRTVSYPFVYYVLHKINTL